MPRPAAASDPFLAVADPTRRAILDLLHRLGGAAPFADIAARFPMSPPAISRHLRVLRDAHLIRERRVATDRRQRVYDLAPTPLRDVAEWVRAYHEYWEGNLASLKQHVERTKGGSRGRPSSIDS